MCLLRALFFVVRRRRSFGLVVRAARIENIAQGTKQHENVK